MWQKASCTCTVGRETPGWWMLAWTFWGASSIPLTHLVDMLLSRQGSLRYNKAINDYSIQYWYRMLPVLAKQSFKDFCKFSCKNANFLPTVNFCSGQIFWQVGFLSIILLKKGKISYFLSSLVDIAAKVSFQFIERFRESTQDQSVFRNRLTYMSTFYWRWECNLIN